MLNPIFVYCPVTSILFLLFFLFFFRFFNFNFILISYLFKKYLNKSRNDSKKILKNEWDHQYNTTLVVLFKSAIVV
jgi:hypothetical protein